MWKIRHAIEWGNGALYGISVREKALPDSIARRLEAEAAKPAPKRKQGRPQKYRGAQSSIGIYPLLDVHPLDWGIPPQHR
jgi:hypothetical protein